MARGSKRFTELRWRVDELRRHLLYFLPPPPLSLTACTDQQFDLTRSYVVLVHAEIEAFCEDLVKERTSRAKQTFDTKKQVTPVMRRLFSYYVGKKGRSWSNVLMPSADAVIAAIQSHEDAVRGNNGIKPDSIEKLFFPIGVVESNFDNMWLDAMRDFGKTRGDWAHSSIKVHNPPDPTSELNSVNQFTGAPEAGPNCKRDPLNGSRLPGRFISQHCVMQLRTEHVTVPVPLHNPLRRGTLFSIIRQFGLPKSLFETDH